MKLSDRKFSKLAACVLLAAPALFGATTSTQAQMAGRVRHELVTLPFYGVFDNLAYQIEGGKVTLSGQVSRPTLKTDAGRVVRRIAGVTEVVNEIEVLPLSFYDDRLRLAVLRAIYSQPALQRYALGAIPSIHIIVKNGNVTLEGVVLHESEKQIAGMRANGVSGVFSVVNQLRAERGKS